MTNEGGKIIHAVLRYVCKMQPLRTSIWFSSHKVTETEEFITLKNTCSGEGQLLQVHRLYTSFFCSFS